MLIVRDLRLARLTFPSKPLRFNFKMPYNLVFCNRNFEFCKKIKTSDQNALNFTPKSV